MPRIGQYRLCLTAAGARARSKLRLSLIFAACLDVAVDFELCVSSRELNLGSQRHTRTLVATCLIDQSKKQLNDDKRCVRLLLLSRRARGCGVPRLSMLGLALSLYA